jgi:16S rRNA (cytidine1402-2'-O)-methyltransferase
VVGTPIGNLEDLSFRALRILREVHLIACEDTRHTARLLNHYGVSTRKISYHEHNEFARTRRLLEILEDGKSVALVSDAGMPLVSDPGYEIVSACREAGIRVIPVPGPSALVAALAGSGLPADSFLFEGFLPSRGEKRKSRLRELASLRSTLVFYEAPHRIIAALRDMVEVLGTRQACVARELTKVHEEWLRGSLSEIILELEARPQQLGEFTVVVDGGEPAARAADYPSSIREHLAAEMKRTGSSRGHALKAVARQRGVSRREAYRLLVEENNAAPDVTE